jgi:hypothetical protein
MQTTAVDEHVIADSLIFTWFISLSKMEPAVRMLRNSQSMRTKLLPVMTVKHTGRSDHEHQFWRDHHIQDVILLSLCLSSSSCASDSTDIFMQGSHQSHMRAQTESIKQTIKDHVHLPNPSTSIDHGHSHAWVHDISLAEQHWDLYMQQALIGFKNAYSTKIWSQTTDLSFGWPFEDDPSTGNFTLFSNTSP